MGLHLLDIYQERWEYNGELLNLDFKSFNQPLKSTMPVNSKPYYPSLGAVPEPAAPSHGVVVQPLRINYVNSVQPYKI